MGDLFQSDLPKLVQIRFREKMFESTFDPLGRIDLASPHPLLKLRDRAAQQLGAIIRYKAGSASASTGRTPQCDLATWLAAKPDRAPDSSASSLFDMWLQHPANSAKVAELEPVSADMVTASGAGLDPHITLRNALSRYQLDRVAAARAGLSKDPAKMKADIESLVRALSFTPVSGLVGEPFVNVLELNIELDKQSTLEAVVKP